MGKSRQKKHNIPGTVGPQESSSAAPLPSQFPLSAGEGIQRLRDPIERWFQRTNFYGEPELDPCEFIYAAIFIFRADKGGADLKQAAVGGVRDVIGRIDALQPVLEHFGRSSQSQAFMGLLKESRSLQKFPIVPLPLRRYDLPTLWADLPKLLRTFGGLLSVQCDFLQALRLADKKRVRNRALVWLYIAIRRYADSDTEAHAAVARLIYPADQYSKARGPKDIYDRIRWFRQDHEKEYQQIEQYLQHKPCPTAAGLRLFVLFGCPDISQ